MLRRRAPALAVVLVLATGVLVVPAAAEPSKDRRIKELEEAIGEASAEEAAALRELAGIRSRRAELDAAVAAVDRQIGEVETTLAAHRAEVDSLTAAMLELDRRVAETSGRLGEAEARARDAAAALYRNESGAIPVTTGVFEVESVQDVYVGNVYLSRVQQERRSEVESLAHLKQTIEDLEHAAEARRDEVEAVRREVERRRSELDTLREQQRGQRDAVAQEEKREQQLVASIRARKDTFTAELASLQATSNAINDMLASRQRGQTRATNFTVTRPVPGGISSGFGVRVHPILGNTRMHNGIDMSGAHGTTIKAGADGVVAYAGPRSGYGNTVIVDHGNQYATLYAHASSLHVSTGQRVTAGQTIASVGATGLATGPHLHFEVRLLGVPVNPVNHL